MPSVGADRVAGDRHALEERSGRSVRITRSLNVPGSPSSALQITHLRRRARPRELPLHAGREAGPAAAAQPRRLDRANDFRRRHRERLLDRLAAIDRAEDDRPGLAHVVLDHRLDQLVAVVAVAEPSSPASADRPCAAELADDLAGAVADRSVTTTSLTIAAGAWSHMPMHGVCSSVILPSGVVSPTLMPSSSQKASATRSRPCISSMMSSQSRMTTLPLGCSRGRRRTTPRSRPRRGARPTCFAIRSIASRSRSRTSPAPPGRCPSSGLPQLRITSRASLRCDLTATASRENPPSSRCGNYPRHRTVRGIFTPARERLRRHPPGLDTSNFCLVIRGVPRASRPATQREPPPPQQMRGRSSP
jgi:hypothetical protein